MRKKALRITVCALILLLVPAALLSFAFLLPAQYDETFPAAINDKLDRLADTASPRIIIIGGSGAAFCVRSDLLEYETGGYTVVNFGLYAGLGTAVMLDLAEPYIRSGDIVIFMPEQNEQTLSTYFNADVMWQAFDGAKIPFPSLSAVQRRAMLGAFPTFAGKKASLFFFEDKPKGDSVYSRRSFNSFGDVACAGRMQNIMTNGFDANMIISFDPALLEDALAERLNALAAVCEKNGAKLYYGFCPMNAAAIPNEELSRTDAFAASLNERLDCVLLGAPYDAIMDAGWFFDTNFHLNEAGQIAYTARLARMIKDELGIDEPVSIVVPDMPELSDFTPNDGDETDAECYIFEMRENGVWIVGLSNEGKKRTELTVPLSCKGQPVLGFEALVFSGDTVLRKLSIGRNITTIPDGAFNGCSALTQIIINNPRPETVSVGGGLLDGTNALVVVPSSSYSAYAVNYSWSQYALRIICGETE